MSFLDLDEWLIDLARQVDVVFSPILDFKEYPEGVDLALVEGAIANEDHLGMIRKVRARTRVIVAFGDCAVTGNVTATSRVELLPTARLTGKVISPRVVMQEGAILQGTLEMTGGRGDSPWMTVEELARYLEVDAATVSEWAQGGRLPAQRDGEQWRFERSRIEEWLSHEKIK